MKHTARKAPRVRSIICCRCQGRPNIWVAADDNGPFMCRECRWHVQHGGIYPKKSTGGE